MKPILDEIEEKSNGRITFTVYAGGVLGGGNEQYDIVRTGKADMGNHSGLSYLPGRFPLNDVLSLPGAFACTEAAQEVVLALQDRILYKEHPDVRLLSTFQSQVFYLYTADKPVRDIEDMQGLKIRSSGGIITPAITALGGIPITMAVPDLYLSLQTGVVDGGILGPSAIVSFKMADVIKHVLKFELGYAAQVIIMNHKTWEKIPDDLQPIITGAARKVGTYEVAIFAKDDPAVDAEIIKRGGSTYTLPSYKEGRWVGALETVVREWVADLKAQGLPVKELMDIVREECQRRDVPFPY